MNFASIKKSIAKDFNLTQKQTEDLFNKFIDQVMTVLDEESKFQINGFGTFTKKLKREHKSRNPKTGEEITVPNKFVLKFKPSKSFMNFLDDGMNLTE